MSQIAGVVAMTIAAAVFIGWWTGLPLLASWKSGLGTTKPVTALCLAALGLALLHPGRNSRIAFTVGLTVVAVAALDLSQDLFGVDFGLDRWLAPEAVAPGPWGTPLHTTNATAFALSLAGCSLVLSSFEPHRFAATVLAGVMGAIAVFALLGYLIGIDALYGTASISSPPLPTAFGLVCVAAGIVSQIGVMPALHKPRPLWFLLGLLGCAVVAPLLLLGIYAVIRIADAQREQIREELMSEARMLSADVDREITGEIQALLGLAASPSLRQRDFAAFQQQAEASLALRQSGEIALIDRNMQQLINTWVPFGKPLPKTAVPESVERALATGKTQVTGLFTGLVTKQPMYGIVVPVQIDGENRYTLVRSPDQHALARIVAANELPPGRQTVISDAAHRVIARSGEQDTVLGMQLQSAQWHRADSSNGVFEFIDADGQSSLQAYAWSKLTNWETAVWAPKVVLDAPLTALWRMLGGLTVLAFALVVGSALWLGRLIARSIGHAARTAIAWGEGGPLLLNGTPVAEVNTLMFELRESAAKRREAEEKADLLTREVGHRAKNILSVVDAIAHQVAAGHPEDFPQRFSERIQALAANQDLLIRNEWKGVDIKDLVHAQLAHFGDLIGSRIAVQGRNLRLTGASAQAIGLALHELATNAGKYGALSTNTGRVDIRWGWDHDAFTMSWTERDGPPVSPPKRRGFGTIVIGAMAARSVGGNVDFDYAPSGVRWCLTCPIANVLEMRSITQSIGE